MARKGWTTPKMIDRDYRYQVELTIPERGFGNRLNDMHDWCREHGPDYKQHGGGPNQWHISRWCFKAPEIAAAFQAEFGGKLVEMPPPKWA